MPTDHPHEPSPAHRPASIPPDRPPECEPPSRLATFLEVRAPLDWLGVAFKLPQLARAPRGDGRPILLVPGYLADGLSMTPLRSFLRALGYRASDWGLGRNRGDVEDDIQRLGARTVEARADFDGAPLTLIGWSLGGVLCREVARLFPDSVREVITFGTPIVGGPKYTAVADRMVREKGLDLPALEEDIHRRNRLGFPQAVTAIFSKSDGVVGWRSCVDCYNPQARNVEVRGSHVGLGINPEVWLTIARTLANGA
ncbi:MAG: hypothetical protein AAGD06_03885 [Acidobacteriota bacterium]